MVYHFVHIQEGQWYRPYLFFRVSSSFWTIHKKSLPDEGHGSVKAVHHFLSWYSKFFHVSNHSNDPDEKKEFLLENHIALWDVIKSCDIKGSSDSSIRNIEVNNLDIIIKKSNINKIILNGGKAYELYTRFFGDKNMPSAVKLPSTSPANAAWTMEKLESVWKPELLMKTKYHL